MLGVAGLKSIWEAIRDLFESPAKVVGIEVETEEEMVRDNGKNMMASNTFAIGVTQTNLDDWVSTTRPGKLDWSHSSSCRIVTGDYGDWFGYSLDHASNI